MPPLTKEQSKALKKRRARRNRSVTLTTEDVSEGFTVCNFGKA